MALLTGSTQEHLLSYLQWLDADVAGLPASYRGRLARALRRYGVDGLERTPELEEVVVWMFRSFRRVGELVPAVTGILGRRLRHRDTLAQQADPELRARLDRLAAIQGRQRVVAELARDVRFHYLDEPLLAVTVAEEYARVARDLDALREDPDSAARGERIDRLVACAQPLRALLLRRWRSSDDPRVRRSCWRSTPGGSTGSENCATFRSASTTGGCSARPTTNTRTAPYTSSSGTRGWKSCPSFP